MSRQHRRPLPSWIVVRDRSDQTCANCGRVTADAVIAESLSVAALDGGRRLAPPIALCETCRRDVIYRRGWVPTWCTACQGWRRFGHDHEAMAPAVPTSAAELAIVGAG